MNDSWIIDSEATHHITHNFASLVNVNPLQSEIHLPNGHSACITHSGDVHLTNTIILKQVLYVPTFTCNVLSFAKFSEDNQCELFFTSTKCLMQVHAIRKRKLIGDLQDGMYRLHPKCIQDCSFLFVSSTQTSVELSHIWHYRLGHPSSTVLNHIPSLNFVPSDVSNEYDICHHAKQNKLVFHNSTSHSLALFDIIHCDVWGPYKYPTHGNCHYFLTIVGDFSRCTWLFLFSEKTKVYSLLKHFLQYVTMQFHTTIKVLH